MNKKILPVFLSSLILFTSCSKSDVLDNSYEKTKKLNNLSGKELYRGIVFNSGELKNLLYEVQVKSELISRTDEKNQKMLSQLENIIIDYIETNNPTYFDDFKKTILSKNHYLIKNLLIESSDYTKETTFKILNLNRDEAKSFYSLVNILSSSSNQFINDDNSINYSAINKYQDQSSFINDARQAELLALAIVWVGIYVWFWFVANEKEMFDISINPNSLNSDNLINSIITKT